MAGDVTSLSQLLNVRGDLRRKTVQYPPRLVGSFAGFAARGRQSLSHGTRQTCNRCASAVHKVESTRPPRVLVAFVHSLAASGTTSWRDRREYQSQIRADLPPQSCDLTLRTSCIHCGCELPGMASSEEHCHTFVTHFVLLSNKTDIHNSYSGQTFACYLFLWQARPIDQICLHTIPTKNAY